MSAVKKGKETSEHNYKINDIVLAKIRGFPAWPGQIVDPDKVPPAVAKERQSAKKMKFYCVRFFPAGDYSWVVAKDLSLLQKHEIEAYINEPHKKSGDLLQGYKIALDPSEWEAKIAQKLQDQADEEADEDVDQLDEGEEEEDGDSEPKKKSRKRKRESEVKTPKRKKEGAKSAAGSDSKEKKAPAAKKRGGKKNDVRSKDQVESEDEGAEAEEGDVAADSGKKAGPPAKRTKKDKPEDEKARSDAEAQKVKEWRHKLQRAFLSKTIPKSEDMPEFDQLMTTIEQHGLTIEQLQYSKLGKVMRHISSLEQPIPNNDEFNIKKRAEALLEKWQVLIASAAADTNGVKEETKDEKDEKPASSAAPVPPVSAEQKPGANGEVANGEGVNGEAAVAKVEEPASIKPEGSTASTEPATATAVTDAMDTSA